MLIQFRLLFIIVISHCNYINALNLLRNDPDETEKVSGENAVTKNITDEKEKQETMWPMGIVSYYFDDKSYDYIIKHRLRLAINQLEEASCVRFEGFEEKPERGRTWIHVTNPRKERQCSHEMQRDEEDPGVIILVLGLDCLHQRDILHALLHAIGFKDEVSHPDRDQYVRVLWENIHPKYRPLFRIQVDEFAVKNHVEYDPTSIMQFHDRQFSRNGHAVLASLLPGLLLYPGDNLSPLDKMKLRLMFGHECNKRKLNALLDSCRLAFQNNTNTKPNDEAKNSAEDEDNDHVDNENNEDDVPENDSKQDEDLENENEQNEVCDDDVSENDSNQDENHENDNKQNENDEEELTQGDDNEMDENKVIRDLDKR